MHPKVRDGDPAMIREQEVPTGLWLQNAQKQACTHPPLDLSGRCPSYQTVLEIGISFKFLGAFIFAAAGIPAAWYTGSDFSNNPHYRSCPKEVFVNEVEFNAKRALGAPVLECSSILEHDQEQTYPSMSKQN